MSTGAVTHGYGERVAVVSDRCRLPTYQTTLVRPGFALDERANQRLSTEGRWRETQAIELDLENHVFDSTSRALFCDTSDIRISIKFQPTMCIREIMLLKVTDALFKSARTHANRDTLFHPGRLELPLPLRPGGNARTSTVRPRRKSHAKADAHLPPAACAALPGSRPSCRN